jgi:hypothetical protein
MLGRLEGWKVGYYLLIQSSSLPTLRAELQDEAFQAITDFEDQNS